ncbi:MAG: hypothetical protein FWH22_01975 [Fibromonadales bacterium]|nr:hypothetical protein [Fibromonadales bacterium]
MGFISVMFPKDGIDIGMRKLYFPDIEDVIAGSKTNPKSSLEHLKAIEEELRLQLYRDSLYTDSLSHYIAFFEESPMRIALPGNDWNFFNDFFAELDSCQERGETVRILHYGDSQIEADRMTDYIRQHLQEKFGGAGPGLLSAQPMPSFSINQSASENIKRYSIEGVYRIPASHTRYGVMGQFSAVSGQSFISVGMRRKAYENAKQIQTVRLFVGRDKNFSARLAVQRQTIERAAISDSSLVKVYTWNLPAPASNFSLYTSGLGEIYGVAADGTSGVAVDNIPFRGSSGIFFSSLDKNVMASMLQHLNARLIILQFGGNSVPVISSQKSIENYCNSLAMQIAYFKDIYPEAKIMLIGPSDMSTRVKGKLTTYPFLEPLIEAMRETAMQNGAAFWDMYEVMGGKDSMIKWVRHSPALAASDYVHFSTKGVERIAAMFYETLMVYYDYYHFTANKDN